MYDNGLKKMKLQWEAVTVQGGQITTFLFYNGFSGFWVIFGFG